MKCIAAIALWDAGYCRALHGKSLHDGMNAKSEQGVRTQRVWCLPARAPIAVLFSALPAAAVMNISAFPLSPVTLVQLEASSTPAKHQPTSLTSAAQSPDWRCAHSALQPGDS